MKKATRRRFLSQAPAAAVAAAVMAPAAANAQDASATKPVKKVHYRTASPDKTPLFSGAVSYGNLLFIAGKGAHFDGDIKAHTTHVLDEMKKKLEERRLVDGERAAMSTSS